MQILHKMYTFSLQLHDYLLQVIFYTAKATEPINSHKDVLPISETSLTSHSKLSNFQEAHSLQEKELIVSTFTSRDTFLSCYLLGY